MSENTIRFVSHEVKGSMPETNEEFTLVVNVPHEESTLDEMVQKYGADVVRKAARRQIVQDIANAAREAKKRGVDKAAREARIVELGEMVKAGNLEALEELKQMLLAKRR